MVVRRQACNLRYWVEGERRAARFRDFFPRGVEEPLRGSPETFEKGFASTVEILDDIAVYAPKALDLMATTTV